jgi:hypothetical protein
MKIMIIESTAKRESFRFGHEAEKHRPVDVKPAKRIKPVKKKPSSNTAEDSMAKGISALFFGY